MKKLAVLGMLVVLSSGCGRCWQSLFRGAPCGETCGSTALPAQPAAGCNGCGTGYGSGYSAYDGEIIGDTGYYGSSVIGDSYIVPGATGGATQPMVAPAT